ncbi:MAG TPA: ASKHA domain-containing protein [Syntrophomonas sp.]|nr:ASKHA domain-containing protein [Syntrophomonas sp.]HRW11744.1 ASKHA domain-containing protein [Syntrophomonas sp.]
MAEQIKVQIVPATGEASVYWALPGKTVQQILEMAGWESGGTCGGQKTCGKCKVRIEGSTSPLEANEQQLLMPEEIRNGGRLACYCTLHGDATVYLDLMPAEQAVKNKITRYRPGQPRHSGVQYKSFFIPGRQAETSVPLLDRLQAALPDTLFELTPENLNELHKIDRPGRPALELHALLINRRVCHVEKAKKAILGLALDLGTTSLFAALLDLESGQVLTTASQSNMQRIYGQDMISRLAYVQQHPDGAMSLHKIMINNINAMIDDMLSQTSLTGERIWKICAVGNPVMLHFFLGLETDGFYAAPFDGIFAASMEIPAALLELRVNPLARLVIPPQLGGFVGADMTACLITMQNGLQFPFLLCDIGTNSEIAVCSPGGIWTSSAAAGPALEGGALRCGMRAGIGAIERFGFDNERLTYQVIGNTTPKGICGSGAIDLLAILWENGCINREGTFTARAEELFSCRAGDQGQEIILPDQPDSGATPLVFTQEDIRQLQLAKGAIRTAIDILLHKASLAPADLTNIYLAGAFGSYLDAEKLIQIGLLPPVPRERIKNIGNAAAEGAMLTLVEEDALFVAEQIKKQVHHVELAQEPNFQEDFLHNLNL